MDEYARKKLLALLFAGMALGFSYTPQRRQKIYSSTKRYLKYLDERKLKNEIRKMYRTKLIRYKENSDKSITLILTDKGKMKALTYRFEEMTIYPPKKWDGKWRIVIFDIPEKLRQGRDALRTKLIQIGFLEFQKSVFVFPYPCENELDFIIEFFNLRPYVRVGILENIDNAADLKHKFDLP
ncbi:MAG: hypothetical protein HYV77_00335 [Candidatus Wildermuthbacteria bacterium]|nr:hypothetical protein [Candidatus Wildermuthbacteria bacterium]